MEHYCLHFYSNSYNLLGVSMTVRQIQLNDIERCQVVAKPGLRDHIKKYGIKEPIIVKKLDNGFYHVLDGEERVSVAWELGFRHIAAVVIRPGASAIEIIEEHDKDLFREKVNLSLGTGYVVSSTNCSILGDASHYQAILVKREFVA